MIIEITLAKPKSYSVAVDEVDTLLNSIKTVTDIENYVVKGLEDKDSEVINIELTTKEVEERELLLAISCNEFHVESNVLTTS